MYSWGTQRYRQLGFETIDEDEGNLDKEGEGDTDGSNNQNDSGAENSDGEKSSSEGSQNEEDGGEETVKPPPIVVVEKTPKLIPGFNDTKVTKICAGNHFALAVSSSGHVHSWGRGCFGQLGLGHLENTPAPTRIDALVDFIAIDVSAGHSHALGIFVSREHLVDAAQSWCPGSLDYSVVFSWGSGQQGRLGLGGCENELSPREVTFFRGLNATQIAAGSDHSLVLCGVASHSFLYGFGGNEYGQLGVASQEDHLDMPSYVSEFANVRVSSIGAGARYSVVLTGQSGDKSIVASVRWKSTHSLDLA